jgi:hypothetical protein
MDGSFRTSALRIENPLFLNQVHVNECRHDTRRGERWNGFDVRFHHQATVDKLLFAAR